MFGTGMEKRKYSYEKPYTKFIIQWLKCNPVGFLLKTRVLD